MPANNLLKKKKQQRLLQNDQGMQQVDSAYIEALSLSAREIANGCFCCGYSELEERVADLVASEQPEIIFAESVGSCYRSCCHRCKTICQVLPFIFSYQFTLQWLTKLFNLRSCFCDILEIFLAYSNK